MQDQISEATSRLHGFRMQHWLKECLQCPGKAQTRRLLEDGLIQRSFVYLAEDVGASSAHLRQFPSAFRTIIANRYTVYLYANQCYSVGGVWGASWSLCNTWLGPESHASTRLCRRRVDAFWSCYCLARLYYMGWTDKELEHCLGFWTGTRSFYSSSVAPYVRRAGQRYARHTYGCENTTATLSRRAKWLASPDDAPVRICKQLL